MFPFDTRREGQTVIGGDNWTVQYHILMNNVDIDVDVDVEGMESIYIGYLLYSFFLKYRGQWFQ